MTSPHCCIAAMSNSFDSVGQNATENSNKGCSLVFNDIKWNKNQILSNSFHFILR